MTDQPARILPVTAARRHEWLAIAIKSIAAINSDNRCSQTIRTCSFCGLKRITMHPSVGDPWWEFIMPDTPQRRERSTTAPPCEPKGDVEDIR